MKSFDVVVGKQNGHFLAAVLAYPHIAGVGATAEEAVVNAKSAMEEFLTSAQVVTVTVAAPETSASSVQHSHITAEAAEIAASEFPLAEAWARKMGIRWQDPNNPDYQSYLASLAFLKQQEREAARLETVQLAEHPLREQGISTVEELLRVAGSFKGDAALMEQHIEEIYADRRRQREEVGQELDALEVAEAKQASQ